MRYFLVKYIQRTVRNGFRMEPQMDEEVSVSKRTRLKDLQTSSVILDFKTRSVVKCSLDGQLGVRDFDLVRDYYHKYYPRIIEDMEAANEKTSDTG